MKIHNSRAVKITPTKFKLELFCVILIYALCINFITYIWFKQTKVREEKQFWNTRTEVWMDKGNT